MRFNQAVSSLQKSPCLLCSNWFNWFCNPSCSAVFSAPWCRLYTVPSIRRGAAWMARAGVNIFRESLPTTLGILEMGHFAKPGGYPNVSNLRVDMRLCRPPETADILNRQLPETSYIPPWSISSSVRPVNIPWIISKKGHSTAMICHVTTVSTNTFGLWPSVVCTWQLAAGNFARHQLPRSPLIEEPTVSAIDVASLTSLSCCQRLIKPNLKCHQYAKLDQTKQWSAEI